jgi:orotidine-5'-phosphate decarboxylase
MFNVHALGGATMLRTLMRTLCGDEDTCAAPVVLGVTVLTSMDRQQLNQCGVTRSVKNQVVHLARLCQRCGVHGVVCSGNELPILRRVMGDTFVLVVPGVRPTADARDDQKRVVTPAQAARGGADYIVVGRPIIDAKDPLAAAERVLEELRSGMPARNKQREAH